MMSSSAWHKERWACHVMRYNAHLTIILTVWWLMLAFSHSSFVIVWNSGSSCSYFMRNDLVRPLRNRNCLARKPIKERRKKWTVCNLMSYVALSSKKGKSHCYGHLDHNLHLAALWCWKEEIMTAYTWKEWWLCFKGKPKPPRQAFRLVFEQ